MKCSIDRLIVHAALATFAGPARARRGGEMGDAALIRDGAVAVRGGVILGVGETSSLLRMYRGKTIDAKGRLVTPGLVDAHTHLVFAGDRSAEFEMRLQGVPYLEIAAKGGGILSTVRATRAASEAELVRLAQGRINAMPSSTIEVKSGYGLDARAELKCLRAMKRLRGKTIVPTFLGAHEVPEEYRRRRSKYVDLVIGMIPKIPARFCDVFCEKGVFSVDESRRILRAARASGMGLKIHADEFHRTGGARLAAELGATSADHLLRVTRGDLRALSKAGVVAVLCPTTALSIGRFAPARAMVASGLPVALGSDYNPGTSNTGDLRLSIALACAAMKLTPAEALCASTINAAYAVGEGSRAGSIEPGKRADLAMWEAETIAEIPYRWGSLGILRLGGR